VPADLVKVIIHGTLTFILKVQHAPDLSTVCDALSRDSADQSIPY
jgi:hypothetical protein